MRKPKRRRTGNTNAQSVRVKAVPAALQPARSVGKRKILFVASECAPYAKVGGLGDVVAALPKALRALGHDARIVMPLYASMDRAKYRIRFVQPCCVHMGRDEEQWIGVHAGSLDGKVPVWFVECQRFFGRGGIYDEPWGEYGDNAFRFALLSKAALQICKDKAFIPDVMHAHDWPTALVPVFLKTWDRILSPLSRTASVLTIHNVGYQGKYHASAYAYIGVGREHFTADIFEDFGMINLLKAGIAFADAITTVSPTQAKELLDPIGGQGLAPHLSNRRADLTGILNGCDYEHWNPATDPMIPARFSARDLTGKSVCKAALQRRFALQVRKDWPVLGIVSRFAHQKGFGLLMEALPRALDAMVFELAVLGTGDSGTEDFFRWLSAKYPGRVNAHIGYSNEISHWIEAGSDFFLMPSLYEPCGLNQMYSMKYGSLPVVRATGGLEDTVQNYNESTADGTGFKFLAPTAQALQDTIGWAVSTWFDRPQHFKQLQQSAMAQEFSWEESAKKYLDVYERAISARRALT
jgi:starch synthase